MKQETREFLFEIFSFRKFPKKDLAGRAKQVNIFYLPCVSTHSVTRWLYSL